MALTELDKVAALVIIDLQKGIVGMPMAHSSTEIVGRAAKLARAFREKNLPVVLVNVAGRPPGRTETSFNISSLPPDWTDLVAELDRQPSDYAVTKFNIGAFYGTALELILRRSATTQVVVAGIATSAGVEATARGAFDRGFNVVTVTDAMTDRNAEVHQHSVEKVFPRISETASTDEVLRHLSGRTN
jgi:nicotinamidase-related amidase